MVKGLMTLATAYQRGLGPDAHSASEAPSISHYCSHQGLTSTTNVQVAVSSRTPLS